LGGESTNKATATITTKRRIKTNDKNIGRRKLLTATATINWTKIMDKIGDEKCLQRRNSSYERCRRSTADWTMRLV
uniref:Uncharacterized protein n=1 Tax=Romanomermis culicivorax TaxID=13658 RepID=A0A915K822_ROMCU